MSLAQAVARVTAARGRKLQINPSFWMELAILERELSGSPAGTAPSFDFSAWWIEDFTRMGVPEPRIRAALEKGDWVDFNVASAALFEEGEENEAVEASWNPAAQDMMPATVRI